MKESKTLKKQNFYHHENIVFFLLLPSFLPCYAPHPSAALTEKMTSVCKEAHCGIFFSQLLTFHSSWDRQPLDRSIAPETLAPPRWAEGSQNDQCQDGGAGERKVGQN